MAKKALPSPEVLRQLLRYEPDTGKLFWRERTPDQFEPGYRHPEWNCRHWNSKYAGKEAFTASRPEGYRVGRIAGNNYRAHRIIWRMVYGEDIPDFIDHINGDPSDNRISNLRLATGKQNSQNRTKTRGTSRYLGVCWNRSEQNWLVQLRRADGTKYQRRFRSEIEAAKAYDAEAIRCHGEFASLNFPKTKSSAA